MDEVPDKAVVEALIIESCPDAKPMTADEYDAHVAALAVTGIPEEVKGIMAGPESSDSDVADSDVDDSDVELKMTQEALNGDVDRETPIARLSTENRAHVGRDRTRLCPHILSTVS